MYKVIIIGGCPFTGKSTLARLLSEQLHYSNICTDDLGAAISAMFPDDAVHHPAGKRGYGEYYLSDNAEKLISDTLKLHDKLKPAIMKVVEKHLSYSSPAVIEGWCLYPGWFIESGENVEKIWLISDKDTLGSRIENDTNFFFGHKLRKKIIEKYLLRCEWQNQKICEEAEHTHQIIIKVDLSTKPEQMISKTIALLT